MIEERPVPRLDDQAQVDAQHPWPGLPSFGEADRDFFFGRDGEAEDLSERIELHRLTVLFGLSGLGKTSLLQAGVFPRLKQRGYLPAHVRLHLEDESVSPDDQVARELERASVMAGVSAIPRTATESVWE